MPQLACSTKLVLIQLHEGLLQCFSGAFMFWLQIMIGGLSVIGGLSDCRHFFWMQKLLDSAVNLGLGHDAEIRAQ